MDGSRFDDVAKSWAHGISRRTILRGLVATVVGAASAPALRGEAAETCTAAGQACNFDVDCCVGTCTFGVCRCPSGKVNCGGLCRDNCDGCPPGFRKCNGVCRDLASDRNHCGFCGSTCRKGSHCSNGRCCGQGEVNCGGVCVPQFDCV